MKRVDRQIFICHYDSMKRVDRKELPSANAGEEESLELRCCDTKIESKTEKFSFW